MKNIGFLFLVVLFGLVCLFISLCVLEARYQISLYALNIARLNEVSVLGTILGTMDIKYMTGIILALKEFTG